jgi:exopolyphosphatase/guanosine-5'-triphosphate,3'-diphosphate pyrophosphatase
VRRACIDIGSNTTRLLVAACHRGRLEEVHQVRSFTQLRRGVLDGGRISPEKIAEVVAVVSSHLALARELGAAEVLGVATAAVRRATNGAELIVAIRDACGLEVVVLSEEQEARMAFIGAATTLGHSPDGELGVVDVGGGSSELVVGIAPDEVRWSTSFAVGSGDLADRYLRSDPPSEGELRDAHDRVQKAFAGIEVPRPAEAVAVGGTATSLRLFAGAVLDSAAFGRSLRLLATERAAVIAARFGLDAERVLILQGASELLGAPLQVGRGGLREGVLLEASRA